MNKRRLTRRQSWRVAKIQEERVERANRKTSRIEAEVDTGILGQEQSGLLIASFGPMVEIEDESGHIHRCALRQNLGLPVVGDSVVWQAAPNGNGVVVAIQPRRSVLARPDFNNELKPLAANIDQILVVAAPLPQYDTDLIDQYLVAAEATGITPVIVLNKLDLLNGEQRAALDLEFSLYAALGYQLLHASTRANHGLDELVSALHEKTSVFVGQSGVGKSSLVKLLLPDVDVRIGDLAEATGLGRHTTSSARLYHLPSDGKIIDSPGVRDFRLWDLDRDTLARSFREFRDHLGNCRFRDCRHEKEPGCALIEAMEKGEISMKRLESYRRIVAEVGSMQRPHWERA